jgi:hypothetical protein
MSSENPFEQLDPGDGYRAKLVDQGGLSLSLHMLLYYQSQLQPCGESQAMFRELADVRLPEAEQRGGLHRLKLLAEAVGRFFTSGGSWPELDALLTAARPFIAGGLQFEGYHYLDGYTDSEGNFTHLWADSLGNVVRWVEDEFIDTGLTLADLRQELEADAAEEEDVCAGSEAPDRECIEAATEADPAADAALPE